MNIKDIISASFPFLLYINRRNKLLIYKKNNECYKTFMLHNIFSNDMLKDWIFNIKKLKEYFNFKFIPIEKNDIAITIDDGFKNIKPFLDYTIKNNIPVTLFISPLGFENKIFPYSVFIQFFRRFEGKNFKIDNYEIKFFSKHKIWREREAFKFNRYLMKKFSLKEYILLSEDILKKYKELFKTIDNDLQLLNEDDIIYYSKFNNISIQSHGIYHFNLSRMTEKELVKELKKSKESIESVTKKSVDYFAYPYGFYDEKVVNFTKKFYKKAFIVDCDNNKFHINRMGLDRKKLKIIGDKINENNF
jgi:hypothetical protein